MIVLGSYAAAQHGIDLGRTPKDVDLIGTASEMEAFRRDNADAIADMKIPGPNRIHFILKEGLGIEKIEFDTRQTQSDRLLPDLCVARPVQILGSTAALPTINALYLTKRSHANYKLHLEKHLVDLAAMKPAISEFTEQEREFYKTRRQETKQEYKSGVRFSFDIRNEDFFAVSNHIRIYEHDDVHRAIAFTKGAPLFEKCKEDLSKAKFSKKMFYSLPFETQLKVPQEEFMVIGIERYYMRNRKLPRANVYRAGLVKVLADLCSGWFQDFCIDNIDRLIAPPDHDFIARFEEAERAGELRRLAADATPASQLEYARKLYRANDHLEAELILRSLTQTENVQIRAAALMLLAAIAYGRRQLDAAEGFARDSFKLKIGGAAEWTLFGNIVLDRGKPDLAIRMYQEALKRSAKHVPAHINLGRAYEAKKNLAAARSAYQHALTLNPGAQFARRRLQLLAS